MTMDIGLDTILQPTAWCVARPQTDRHLIYNSRTDEMHLVPPTGMLVYQMCDGLLTVGEIGSTLEAALPEHAGNVRPVLKAFFDKLVARGIVEVAHDD